MEDKDRYAIGQQDFRTLRKDNAFYIDKTAFVEKIAKSKTKYYFLARPRRFGKSLFLSTLKYFFEGRRELFKGLYVDSMDWDWEPYPVLHLDFNTDRFADTVVLEDVLERQFSRWEKEYGIDVTDRIYSQRLGTIIEKAHEKTGKQVVILVDEYDKPLVSNLRKTANFEYYRTKLASIYSNFKSSAEHIRLVFMTGISRFSKLSVFSDLNNLRDITFSDDYADVCGITEKELIDNLQEGIHALAEASRISYEEGCRKLKQNYDGYRFARSGSDIYNPWSVLSAMTERRIGDFWNDSGPASVVAHALQDADVDIEETLRASWRLNDLAGLDLLNADPTALLYQAGYLTIGDYDYKYEEVRLKVPNEEVKRGLFNDLLKCYLKPRRGTVRTVIDGITRGIREGEPEKMMRHLDAYFAGIPYDLKMDRENNFHNAFYILTTLIGIDAKAEAHTSDGRIDLLIETPEYIYVIELKFNSPAEEALKQIEEKGYARQFETDPRKLFRIGVCFSSEKRRIEGWKIES